MRKDLAVQLGATVWEVLAGAVALTRLQFCESKAHRSV
jgi:hypothetical protein